MKNSFSIYLTALFVCLSIVACGGDDDQYVGGVSHQVQNGDNGTASDGEEQNQANTNTGAQDKTPVVVKAVDLGLSVRWASCNVGACKAEEYGDYFAWGETEGYNSGKKKFSWSTYKWCTGSSTTITKYCTDSSYGTVDNKITLEPEDDAATVNWGCNWRMPTKTELEELRNIENCTWTWTKQNGVNGYKIVSKRNGNFIFLPAAGHCDSSSSLSDAGSKGLYWSRSLDKVTNCVSNLFFSSSDVDWNGYNDGKRCRGRSIRAVCP